MRHSSQKRTCDGQILIQRSKRTLLALKTSQRFLHRDEFPLQSDSLGFQSLVDPADPIVLGLEQRLVLSIGQGERSVHGVGHPVGKLLEDVAAAAGTIIKYLQKEHG